MYERTAAELLAEWREALGSPLPWNQTSVAFLNISGEEGEIILCRIVELACFIADLPPEKVITHTDASAEIISLLFAEDSASKFCEITFSAHGDWICEMHYQTKTANIQMRMKGNDKNELFITKVN